MASGKAHPQYSWRRIGKGEDFEVRYEDETAIARGKGAEIAWKLLRQSQAGDAKDRILLAVELDPPEVGAMNLEDVGDRKEIAEMMKDENFSGEEAVTYKAFSEASLRQKALEARKDRLSETQKIELEECQDIRNQYRIQKAYGQKSKLDKEREDRIRRNLNTLYKSLRKDRCPKLAVHLKNTIHGSKAWRYDGDKIWDA